MMLCVMPSIRFPPKDLCNHKEMRDRERSPVMKNKYLTIVALLLACLLILPACEIAGDTSDLTASDTTAESVADTETEAVTEDNTPTPPALPALDTYQGMTPDVPYTLRFYSNGDGTCSVREIVVNMLHEGPYTVDIPETSPDGDTVVEVSYLSATYNLPRYLTKEAYETLVGWWEDYFDRCVEQGLMEANVADFRLSQACSYYILKDATADDSGVADLNMITRFPLCEHIPVYALDIAVTEVEIAHLSQLMAAAAPWYTTEWCYAELLTMKSLADEFGVKDPHLEESLAEHSDSLAEAETVRIPHTVTQIVDQLYTLSSMGVTRLIFDGTTAEFDAIFWGQSSKLITPYLMTVQCSDGELTLDKLEVRYPALSE